MKHIKKIRKSLALSLIFILSASMFCGCSSSSQTSERDITTFRIMEYGINSIISSKDDPVGQELLEKFGVEIEFIPQSDVDPLTMLYANDWGNLDMIATYGDTATREYLSAGAFINLDDYRDRLDNFYDYHSDSIPYWRTLSSDEGLYIWQTGPDQEQLTNAPTDVAVRVDVLEALGWPVLETADDYYSFLKEALKRFPKSYDGRDSLGMIAYWGDEYGPLLCTYLPRHSGMQDCYTLTALIDPSSEKFVSKIDNPLIAEALHFLNKLYREGLIDKEVFQTEEDDFNDKFLSGRAITAFFGTWMVDEVNATMEAAGHPEMQYIVMPIRLNSFSSENVRYEAYTYLYPDETKGILKTCKNPELLLDVINYLSTKEMTLRCGWGVEGTDYTVDDKGIKHPTEEFMQIASKADAEEQLRKKGISFNYQQAFPMRMYAVDENGQANMYSTSVEYKELVSTDTQQRAYNKYGWENYLSPWRNNESFDYRFFNLTDYQIATYLDSNTDAELIVKSEEITEYLNRQIPTMVTAMSEESLDSILNETINSCYEMGLQSIIDAYNSNLKVIRSK